MQYWYYFNGEKLLIGYDYNSWAFFLCVDRIPSLAEWKNKFAEPGSYIKRNARRTISPEEMEVLITMRFGDNRTTADRIQEYGTSVFEGSHTLVHIRVGHMVGIMHCAANEGCWDLYKSVY